MSKNFWAIIISSVVIGVCIIISGNAIANKINMVSYSGGIPVTVTNGDNANPPVDTFLTEPEAAAYLKLSDTQFQNLLQSGDLSATYTILQGQKIFSENALSIYMYHNIGNTVSK